MKSHDACQDSCPYVIHITSAGKSKPVSSPGIIIMLIMMHPVSVGNSEVQQSVLKYMDTSLDKHHVISHYISFFFSSTD